MATRDDRIIAPSIAEAVEEAYCDVPLYWVKTDAAENESDTARRADHYGPQLANYRHSIPQLLGLPADRITTILLFTKLPLVLEV